jgi:hypothetical protein
MKLDSEYLTEERTAKTKRRHARAGSGAKPLFDAYTRTIG